MIWKHTLSNIDMATMTADCANCGRVDLKMVKHRGTVRCREAVRAENRKHKEKTRYHGLEKPKECEICGGTNKLCYDHNHVTGKHRGWLCHTCNVALGMAKDSPELLQKMIDYLQERGSYSKL